MLKLTAPTITWGHIYGKSSAQVWQLCAASIGASPESLDDPLQMKQWLVDALWEAMGVRSKRGRYSAPFIEQASKFCERVELVAMTLTAGNIFGVVTANEFLGLADAAEWLVDENFFEGRYIPLEEQSNDSVGGVPIAQIDMELRGEVERLRSEVSDRNIELENAQYEIKKQADSIKSIERERNRLGEKLAYAKKVSLGRLKRLRLANTEDRP